MFLIQPPTDMQIFRPRPDTMTGSYLIIIHNSVGLASAEFNCAGTFIQRADCKTDIHVQAGRCPQIVSLIINHICTPCCQFLPF